MRLPRNVKMLRGPVDPSALAGTLFLLWTVTLLQSSLMMPPGVRLELPEAEGITAEVLPDVAVGIDQQGRLLFEQQVIAETNLEARLRERTQRHGTNQTLLLLADRRVTAEHVGRLVSLARNAGIRDIVLATSPRPGTGPLDIGDD
jgi:biopolymer transport protein ExbD